MRCVRTLRPRRILYTPHPRVSKWLPVISINDVLLGKNVWTLFWHAAFAPSADLCLLPEADGDPKCSICALLVLFVRFSTDCNVRFSTEAYTSTLRCRNGNGQNWSKFWGTQIVTKNYAHLNVCTSFADSYTQPFTSSYSPRYWGALLMGCVKASGTPGSSRRQPETTHEVFPWTRSSQPAAQRTP